MNGLTVRDIEFNGATIKAAQDINNIIWVGVKWICDGIGLSEGQIKNERKRLREDLVLSKGGRNFVLPYKWWESRSFMYRIRLFAIMVSKDFHYSEDERK